MTLFSNPIGLCPTCQIYLYSAKKGETLSLVTLERWLLTSERIKLLPRFKGETVSTCDCLLCIMSRDKSKSINLQDVLNMYINDPEVPKEIIDKICCTCYQRIGSGIQHPCNKRDIVQNLKTLLMSTGLKTVEQVLSKSLKEIQQFKNIELDNTITLSTGGTPLSLQIGKKPTLKTISTQTFYNIKRKHDMSDYTIDSIAMELRKDLGRLGVESNSSKKNKIMSHALNNYYSVEKVEFLSKNKVKENKTIETVIKDLVYVKDPVSLVNHVCIARGLEVENVIIRIGIDSGQGSLKVIMNVFNREVNYDSKETKNTGVNKVIILAFAKNVCESHTNLQILIEKTKLNNLKFYLAADLKLCNIVLGLSGHGRKYSTENL
ncbi:uncharacterized protein LOC124809426 isoform X1 [Hydra vulgaris]|uniref:uncharacterized protein LOC124809426 isoform X1 n=1 Tax=Hydra vulgaris TaxID=6087 RepID=UPI001F5E5B53|nr:uncharacterized protein LOC124809426 [Hydra vulgaris]